MRPLAQHPGYQDGATMIEVLVSIIILTLGLLGLAGLHMHMQTAAIESYQRAQAVVLLNDMANRLLTNRYDAANYVTTSPLGTGVTCATTSSSSTRQQVDSAEWCRALQGAAETSGGSNIGAMVGGRGCVQDLGNGLYMITVAWQGMAPVSAPPASVSCGQGSYDTTGTACVNDRCRLVVTTTVQIATL